MFLCLLGVLGSLTTGCSSTEVPSELLDSAEDMLVRGDIASAMKTVDGILESDDSVLMNWRDYCRAYVIYSVAYDGSVESDHALERSSHCLASARALNRDSAASYLNSLPADRLSAVLSVSNILQTLEEGRQFDVAVLDGDHDIDPAMPDSHQDNHETAEGQQE